MKTPHQINAYLNERIIGQEHAKRVLSVALYNHKNRLDNPDLNLRKSNVMLIGPSGSGKTMLVKALADLMGVPFYIGDATSLTAAGYIGQDSETLLAGLVKNASGSIHRAEKGIIFIDEFDKLRKASASGNSHGQLDVGGEAVQQSILKMLEGSDVEFALDGTSHPRAEKGTINTENILFILGGAFVGLADKNPEVTTENLIDYGIIPEVLGRVPIVAQLRDLTREEMRRVLTEIKDSPVDEYKKLFSIEQVELEFSDCALNRIVDFAIEKKTGARSLRSIIELSLLELMFDLPSQRGQVKKVTVTGGAIDRTEKPRLYKVDKSKRQQRRDRAKDKPERVSA